MPPIENDYRVIFRNESHANIYIQSQQLTSPLIELSSMEESDTIYSSNNKIEIKWFGEGTYYKTCVKDFLLKKDDVSKIILTIVR